MASEGKTIGTVTDRHTGRYTVAQAADILGITTGAVRNRLSRGTLHSVKEHGTVYVLLPSQDVARDTGETPHDIPHLEPDALISELRAHNAMLREQLEQAHERDRENRRIIAALTSRIPELPAAQTPSEAPRSAPGAPETVESPGPRERPFTDEERAQEAAEPRPWWRRMFGG